MKILSIGNSFSQDAHKYLNELAVNNFIDLQTVNLYIGGCNLETHWNNVIENKNDYDLEINGEEAEKTISIEEALQMTDWDVITLQQASYQSGEFDTYNPYLEKLAIFIKEKQPNARLYFHETWTYEIDFDNENFVRYNNNQKEMYEKINSAVLKAAEKIDAKIIPVGTIIQMLRNTMPEFDYENGGMSLCRDGFHLSYDYGRYVAALTWLYTLTQNPINIYNINNLDCSITKKIRDVVITFLKGNV